MTPGKCTLSVLTKIFNPYSHTVHVNSIIESTDLSVVDTVGMYDDGSHGDKTAGDGLYSGYWPVSADEKEYMVHISTITLDSLYKNLLSDAANFTTIGPVVFDSVYIAQQIGTRSRVRLVLRNNGTVTTAADITAELRTSNPQISIEDNFRPFDDIAPGKKEESKSFYIFIAQNPVDSILVFIDVLSDNKFFWSDSFMLSFVPLSLSDANPVIPLEFNLKQNYPNPFNPSTTIEFSIPKPDFVSLKVYDSVGQEVARLLNRQISSGSYKYVWDASGFASGVYYYKLEAGNYVDIKKLFLIK